MEIIFAVCLFFALPIILAVAVAVTVFSYLSALVAPVLSVLFSFFIACLVFALIGLPLRPVAKKYPIATKHMVKTFEVIFIYPPIIVVLGALCALPFALIFAIAESPFIWSGTLIAFVLFCVYQAYKEKYEKTDRT
ncbi:hypothetical protein [Caviibacterium pharyngocola]|uniref:Uncharacterized protein n=1 Tax=Caviibacterium pharyngocola TaxID=28159 RepID=A0A2M8RTA5_9PAST|nr:hypothetical protein [Caviibacterium pharyngocola]PJG82123.1 hypothetical protein CVP04_10735 [Caviibacterium pharyngocola]